MPEDLLVTARCRISRSGFPSERVFRVTQADGTEHIGAAPANYFFGADGSRLLADQPAQRLVQIPGFVAARVLNRTDDGTLLLSVPSGEVLWVQPSEVVDHPNNVSRMREGAHVPVQS